MNPELRFAITAQNRSSAALKAVAADVRAVGASANAASGSMTRLGNEMVRTAGLNRTQMMMLGHEARATFDMLAAGASPVRALTLEAGNLASALAMGEGGVAGSLAAIAPVALPVIGVLAGVGAAVAGLTSELDRDTGKNITFMQTLKAIGQAIWANLTNLVGPAVKQVGTWFGDLVHFIAPALKQAGNAIIGTFVGAFNGVKDTWSALPAALGDIAIQTTNSVLSGIGGMINGAIDQLDSFIGAANDKLGAIGIKLATIGHVGIGQVPNPFAGATSGVSGKLAADMQSAMGTDYAGNFYGQVKQFALQDYAADAGTANDAVKKLARDGIGKLTEAQRAAAKELDFYRDAFSGFFSDLADGLKQGESVWQSFGDAASKALSSIGNHLLELATNSIFNSLFGSLFGGGGFGFGNGFSIAGMPMYASGTNFAAGGLSLVGERGPELVNLPRGAQVVPAGRTAAMLAGGQTVTINITGSRQDAAEIARVVSATLDRQFPDRAAAFNRNNLRRA